MTLKFIKNVTKEGDRKVINIPKRHYDKIEVGKKMLVSELDLKNMTKEELQELI